MARRNEAATIQSNFMVDFQSLWQGISVVLVVTSIGTFLTIFSRLELIETKCFRFVDLVAFEVVGTGVVLHYKDKNSG